MKKFLLALLLLTSINVFAQQPAPRTPTPEPQRPAVVAPVPDEAPVNTKHEVTVSGKTLKYSVTTGRMPIKNPQNGETEALMFYMAYTLDGVSDKAKRPLTFSFNGGPG